MNIIILDDNILITDVILALIEDMNAGHNVVVVNDSKELLKHLKDESFDLMVSDWRLISDVDGKELLHRIVNEERLISKGILITSYVRTGEILLKSDFVTIMPKTDFINNIESILKIYERDIEYEK